MTHCSLCRHYRRTRIGPHFQDADTVLWEARCALSQSYFPHALDCAFYAETGLGYAWDSEYEGPA